MSGKLTGVLLLAAIEAWGQQQPSKEYIRLGGRVIAIESSGGTVSSLDLWPSVVKVPLIAGQPAGLEFITRSTGTPTYTVSGFPGACTRSNENWSNGALRMQVSCPAGQSGSFTVAFNHGGVQKTATVDLMTQPAAAAANPADNYSARTASGSVSVNLADARFSAMQEWRVEFAVHDLDINRTGEMFAQALGYKLLFQSDGLLLQDQDSSHPALNCGALPLGGRTSFGVRLQRFMDGTRELTLWDVNGQPFGGGCSKPMATPPPSTGYPANYDPTDDFGSQLRLGAGVTGSFRWLRLYSKATLGTAAPGSAPELDHLLRGFEFENNPDDRSGMGLAAVWTGSSGYAGTSSPAEWTVTPTASPIYLLPNQTVDFNTNFDTTWALTSGHGSIEAVAARSVTYRAPLTMPTSSPFQGVVTATRVSPAASTTRTMVIRRPLEVLLSGNPVSNITVPPNTSVTFSSNLPGETSWSLQSGVGSINSSGVYTAPGSGSAVVRATDSLYPGNVKPVTITISSTPFTLSVQQPSSSTFYPGSTISTQVLISRNSYTGSVALSCQPVGCSIPASTVENFATVAYTVPVSNPPASVTLSVTGSGGGHTASDTKTVAISTGPGTITLNPQTVQVQAGTGSYAYFEAGSPNPSFNTFLWNLTPAEVGVWGSLGNLVNGPNGSSLGLPATAGRSIWYQPPASAPGTDVKLRATVQGQGANGEFAESTIRVTSNPSALPIPCPKTTTPVNGCQNVYGQTAFPSAFTAGVATFSQTMLQYFLPSGVANYSEIVFSLTPDPSISDPSTCRLFYDSLFFVQGGPCSFNTSGSTRFSSPTSGLWTLILEQLRFNTPGNRYVFMRIQGNGGTSGWVPMSSTTIPVNPAPAANLQLGIPAPNVVAPGSQFTVPATFSASNFNGNVNFSCQINGSNASCTPSTLAINGSAVITTGFTLTAPSAPSTNNTVSVTYSGSGLTSETKISPAFSVGNPPSSIQLSLTQPNPSTVPPGAVVNLSAAITTSNYTGPNPVALSCGWSCSPASVLVPPSGTTPFTLTLRVPNNASGNQSVSVTASGAVSQNVSLNVQPNAPSLSITGATTPVVSGNLATTTLSLSYQNLNPAQVWVACSLSNGTSVSCSPDTSPAQDSLGITMTGLPVGANNVSVQVWGNGASDWEIVPVMVGNQPVAKSFVFNGSGEFNLAAFNGKPELNNMNQWRVETRIHGFTSGHVFRLGYYGVIFINDGATLYMSDYTPDSNRPQPTYACSLGNMQSRPNDLILRLERTLNGRRRFQIWDASNGSQIGVDCWDSVTNSSTQQTPRTTTDSFWPAGSWPGPGAIGWNSIGKMAWFRIYSTAVDNNAAPGAAAGGDLLWGLEFEDNLLTQGIVTNAPPEPYALTPAYEPTPGGGGQPPAAKSMVFTGTGDLNLAAFNGKPELNNMSQWRVETRIHGFTSGHVFTLGYYGVSFNETAMYMSDYSPDSNRPVPTYGCNLYNLQSKPNDLILRVERTPDGRRRFQVWNGTNGTPIAIDTCTINQEPRTTTDSFWPVGSWPGPGVIGWSMNGKMAWFRIYSTAVNNDVAPGPTAGGNLLWGLEFEENLNVQGTVTGAAPVRNGPAPTYVQTP